MQQNITPNSEQERILIEKIRTLSPDKIAEVVDFLDFLIQRDRDRRLLKSSHKLAEEAFRKLRGNPEDAVYDRL